MTHADPSSLADLVKAIAELDRNDRDVLIRDAYGVSERYHEEGEPKVAEVFFRLSVVAAEEHDHQWSLNEHGAREVEGVGSLLSEYEPASEPKPDGLAGGNTP